MNWSWASCFNNQTPLWTQVTPIVKESYLRELDPHVRSCLYEDEIEFIESQDCLAVISKKYTTRKCQKKELIGKYSQSGCYFQCWMSAVHKTRSCSPWKFPRIEGEGKSCECHISILFVYYETKIGLIIHLKYLACNYFSFQREPASARSIRTC